MRADICSSTYSKWIIYCRLPKRVFVESRHDYVLELLFYLLMYACPSYLRMFSLSQTDTQLFSSSFSQFPKHETGKVSKK